MGKYKGKGIRISGVAREWFKGLKILFQKKFWENSTANRKFLKNF